MSTARLEAVLVCGVSDQYRCTVWCRVTILTSDLLDLSWTNVLWASLFRYRDPIFGVVAEKDFQFRSRIMSFIGIIRMCEIPVEKKLTSRVTSRNSKPWPFLRFPDDCFGLLNYSYPLGQSI